MNPTNDQRILLNEQERKLRDQQNAQTYDAATEPDPEKVREFLAREAGITKAQLDSPPDPMANTERDGGIRDGVLSPEDLQDAREALGQKKEEAAEPDKPRVEVPIAEHARQAHSPSKFHEMLEFVMKSEELGEVKVTEEEQNRYGVALMTDEELVWDIPVQYNGIQMVRIRGWSIADRDAINCAAAADIKDKVVQEGLDMLNRMTEYFLCVQVLSVNNVPIDRSILAPEGAELSVRVAKLREMRNKVVGRYGGPKMALLVRAIMVFEAKIKLCHDAAANGTFS